MQDVHRFGEREMSSRTLSLLAAALVAVAWPVAADFTDNDYHEYILNDWDTAQLDVFVIPPAAPSTARLAAVETSIAAWEAGIAELGASWLTSALALDAYVVHRDVAPAAAIRDPEILVVSAEFNPFVLFGIGAGWDSIVCDSVDEFTSAALSDTAPGLPAPAMPAAWHQHEGSAWAVRTTTCEARSQNVCVVLNTNFALQGSSQFDMYDLNAHEFGHCLGIGHVGDALDFEARNFPTEDIMSYQSNPDQVHCVSTLNVRSIEGVFAHVLGRPDSEALDGGDFLRMSPSAYSQVDCVNP